MTNTKRYTAESCHDIGYAWEIEAPDNITAEELEKLQQALCNWTDEPDQARLNEMLEDDIYLEDYELNEDKMEFYKAITINVESVHRGSFIQSFQEV